MPGRMTTAAPMIGPRVGPPEMQMETNAMAIPRASGDQMSLSAAGTLLIGADANIPPTNRVNRILAAFLLTAVPIVKQPITKNGGSIPIRRP